MSMSVLFFFFFQAEDGIRDYKVTGVQTCALPICLALPRAGVGVGALAAHRQAAAVADAAVGADVHEALDVHRDLAPQVALDLQLALDDLAHPRRLLVRPRLDPLVAVDVGLLEDVDRGGLADPVDIRDRNLPPLLPRQIHSRHSRHITLLGLARAPALPAQSLSWCCPGGGIGGGHAGPLRSSRYPCRCLCRGFLQMIRTTPRRLTILQCSQRTLTDGRTFTDSPRFSQRRLASGCGS